MERIEIDINTENLGKYFLPQHGWKILELPPRFFDRRVTRKGDRIRCIDYRFGQTQKGYDPDTVPLSPAWLGAIDGVAAFFNGNAETRMASAVKMTEAVGFKRADHGDYIQGDEGCAFRRALFESQFPDLAPLSRVESRVLRTKFKVEHIVLHTASSHPDGFVINNRPYTTVLPEDGKHYPIDLWFAQMVGISSGRSLPVIAKCGELLLPENRRNLYLIQD